MQKITPNLWFDTQAKEAAGFYTSIFKNSKVIDTALYGKEAARVSRMPEGSILSVEFELEGYRFTAINGGPVFKMNPSVSFSVACETREEIDTLWRKLVEGGSVLMELDKYPYSERYGWLQDKYGLSWQLGLGYQKQKIVPSLMYVGKQAGKAEEAINYYVSIFPDSSVGTLSRYEKGGPDPEGTVNYGPFTLFGQDFVAMDSALDHKFNFNEAVSLMVECKDQPEIEYYWGNLTAGGEESVCGWLKDRYGLSWQVVPGGFSKFMKDPDLVRKERVMKVFFQMKKIDIAALQRAYEGK